MADKGRTSEPHDSEQSVFIPTEQRKLIDELTRAGSDQKVRIEGDAGAGKSTFLEEVCWTVACDPESRRIPIIARLDQWPEFIESTVGTTERTLVRFLAFTNTSLDADFIRRLCFDNHALVLLDGLDEVRDDDSRVALARWLDEHANSPPFQQSPVVLAGRPWAFTQSAIRTFSRRVVTLEPLTCEDIEQYIRVYFKTSPELGRSLSHHVRTTPQVSRLVSSPLFLAMLCFVWREDQSNRVIGESHLLSRATRHMVERRRAQIFRELEGSAQLSQVVCQRVLSLLAWTSWTKSSGTYLHEDDALEALVNILKDDHVLSRELKNVAPSILLGALVRHSGLIGATDVPRYRFTNHRILEYLAGYHLAELEAKELIEVFARNAWNPRWRGIFVHVAAELSKGSSARQELGRSLIRWVLLESQDGHDDQWGTLILLAAEMAASGPELLPVETEDRTLLGTLAFKAWRISANMGAALQVDTACNAFGGLAAVLPEPCMRRLVELFEESTTCFQNPLNGNPRYGVAAVKTLAISGRDECVDLLISIVGERFGLSCEVSNAAVVALGELGITRALGRIIDNAFEQTFNLGPLLRGINFGYQYNRWIESARRIGAASAARYVRPRLASGNPEARSVACVLLGGLRDRDSIAELRQLVETENDPTVRKWAIDALGRIDATEATDTLVQLLSEDREPSTKATALEALARIGTREAAEVIAQHYADLPLPVAGVVVYQVPGEDEWVSYCRSDLPVPCTDETNQNCWLLRVPGTNDSVMITSEGFWDENGRWTAMGVLVPQLHDDDEIAELHAMRDLAMMNYGDISPFLEHCAYKATIEVVRLAEIESFGSMHAAESVELLMSLAMDSEEENIIRLTCLESLRRMAKRDSSVRSRLVEPALAMLGEDDTYLHGTAIDVLRENPDERAVPYLAKALARAIGSSSWRRRMSCIAALGEINSDEAVSVLRGLLNHTDVSTRHEALETLGMLRSKKAIVACREIWADLSPENQRCALNAMGRSTTPEAAEFCARSLSHSDASVREQATRSLALIGGECVVELLGRRLADENSGVRDAAARALVKIRSRRAIGLLWTSGFARDASTLCETLNCTILVNESIAERESLVLDMDNGPNSDRQ